MLVERLALRLVCGLVAGDVRDFAALVYRGIFGRFRVLVACGGLGLFASCISTSGSIGEAVATELAEVLA